MLILSTAAAFSFNIACEQCALNVEPCKYSLMHTNIQLGRNDKTVHFAELYCTDVGGFKSR